MLTGVEEPVEVAARGEPGDQRCVLIRRTARLRPWPRRRPRSACRCHGRLLRRRRTAVVLSTCVWRGSSPNRRANPLRLPPNLCARTRSTSASAATLATSSQVNACTASVCSTARAERGAAHQAWRIRSATAGSRHYSPDPHHRTVLVEPTAEAARNNSPTAMHGLRQPSDPRTAQWLFTSPSTR